MGKPKGKVTINVNDIIGERLGKLEVVLYAGHDYDSTAGGERMRHYYLCKCDCGMVKIARRSTIRSKMIHSCGCIGRKRR